MALTSFDGQFSFKQDSLARLGPREKTKMTAEQQQAFQNSPFMQGVRKCEDLCWKFTCSRDQERAKRDPSFKPKDDDFQAAKAHVYDRAIDYYKVLGVDEYASLDEVKKSYKKLSLVYHPDKTAGLSAEQKEEYAGIFIELKNAYLTLGDQATRRQYDRDRDRDKASYEVNGYKPKKRAHFDASEMLKKLREMQKPPGLLIDVPLSAKLEKFFHGGFKKVIRQRRVRDFAGFMMQQRVFRVDVPRGASAPHECVFKRQGDHHEETQPDTIVFKVSCKPHSDLDWKGNDLIFKNCLHLGEKSLQDQFFYVEHPIIRGRHLLIWGRNPFLHNEGIVGGDIALRFEGEGMTKDGTLELTCTLGAKSESRTSVSPGALQPNGKLGMVIVKIRHLQTNGTLWIRVPSSHTTIADVRSKIATLTALPRGAVVRLLQPAAAGGHSPYTDRHPLNGMTSLNCAGAAWQESALTPDRCRSLVSRLESAMAAPHFAARLHLAHQARGTEAVEVIAQLLQSLETEVLPDFGLEPSWIAFERRVSRLSADSKDILQTVLAKVNDIQGRRSSSSELAAAELRRGSGSRSKRRFLQRFGLGPPGGLDPLGPGSETEEEQGGSSSSTAGQFQFQPGKRPAELPAMRRRQARRAAARAQSSQRARIVVQLKKVRAPMSLFTRPSCRVDFFSSVSVEGGMQKHPGATPRISAVLLSTTSSVKKAGLSEWEQLRRNLIPLLKATSFHFFQDVRTMAPRALVTSPAFDEYGNNVDEEFVQSALQTEEESMDLISCCERFRIDSGIDLRNGELEAWREVCTRGLSERRTYLRQTLLVQKQLLASSSSSLPGALMLSPWKSMADSAFRRGDYYSAITLYDRRLQEVRRDSQDYQDETEKAGTMARAAEVEAILLSNRSACFGKLRLWQEAFNEAEAALALRPQWHRGFARKAAAAVALGRMEEAFTSYFEAVSLARGSIEEDIKALSRAARARDVRYPKDEAHKAKERGNAAMRTCAFGLAVAEYTVALALLPDLPPAGTVDDCALLRCILASNRSGAFCRLKLWRSALTDGHLAVQAKEDFAKAHVRLGTAMLGAGLTEQAYLHFAKALALEPNDQTALKGRQTCLAMLPLWTSQLARQRRAARFSLDLARPSGTTRVFAISDVHFDHRCNEEWVHEIDNFSFQEDVLIVAGNLADTRNSIAKGLSALKSKFRRVFYVPGNHEFWLALAESSKYPDSIAKFLSILELCDELEVDVFPAAVAQDAFVVPLFSWYSADFGGGDPFPDDTSTTDQHCRWSIPSSQIWRYMLRLNRSHLELPYHGTVVSCSHFLPKSQLPHAKHSGLAKTTGCEALDEQVRALKGGQRVHVYGHSRQEHSEWDGGILYVNHYHGEDGGRKANAPLKCIYDGQKVMQNAVVGSDGTSG